MNSVAFRALDDHQGKNKIWWIRTFFFLLGLFFLGRTDLFMKGTLLFFKFWFVACFLGSELPTDGLAFEAEYAALQPRGRTSALTRWCVCSVVLGAGYVTGVRTQLRSYLMLICETSPEVIRLKLLFGKMEGNAVVIGAVAVKILRSESSICLVKSCLPVGMLLSFVLTANAPP